MTILTRNHASFPILAEANEAFEDFFPELSSADESRTFTLDETRIAQFAAELTAKFELEDPSIKTQIFYVFEHYRTNNGIRFRSSGSQKGDAVRIPRTALVALLVTVIGASAGYVSPSLNPMVAGMVSAHTAVLLNLLAEHIWKSRQSDAVFGMDAAVLSILSCGHYTIEEIESRIGAKVPMADVVATVEELQKQGLITAGLWPDTFSI